MHDSAEHGRRVAGVVELAKLHRSVNISFVSGVLRTHGQSCTKFGNSKLTSLYYYFRNRITFSETLLCDETTQMQLCHLCDVCAQSAEGAFGNLMQTSAEDLRRGPAEPESNYRLNKPNAFCVV